MVECPFLHFCPHGEYGFRSVQNFGLSETQGTLNKEMFQRTLGTFQGALTVHPFSKGILGH